MLFGAAAAAVDRAVARLGRCLDKVTGNEARPRHRLEQRGQSGDRRIVPYGCVTSGAKSKHAAINETLCVGRVCGRLGSPAS
jgi:hypothetical protein